MATVIPRFLLIIGLGLLILFVFGLVFQIATTEAYISGGAAVSIGKPDWSILMQLPDLVQGQLSQEQSATAFAGWFVELIYLGFLFGGEIMMETIEKGNKLFSKWFKGIVILLVIANGIFDYNYGSIGANFGWQGHLIFAVALAISVGVFGIVGLAFIMKGWGHV